MLMGFLRYATYVCDVSSTALRMGIAGVDLFLYCETDIDVIIDQASPFPSITITSRTMQQQNIKASGTSSEVLPT